MAKKIINKIEDLKLITPETFNEYEVSEELKEQLVMNALNPTSGSSRNLDGFADPKFQREFESLDNASKIDLLKPLWIDGDLPAKQLKDIGYDALSKIEPINNELSGSLYRVYMSNEDLDAPTLHPVDMLPDIGLAGSWTSCKDVAEFFIEHISGGRYPILWGGQIPKYMYLLSTDAKDAEIVWMDDSRNEKEVTIRGIDPDGAGVYVELVGKSIDRTEHC
jgi:hypothetical protein